MVERYLDAGLIPIATSTTPEHGLRLMTESAPLRHHAQPVEYRPHHRRLVRRRGGPCRGGRGAGGACFRRRRIDSRARGLQRAGGPEDIAWPRAADARSSARAGTAWSSTMPSAARCATRPLLLDPQPRRRPAVALCGARAAGHVCGGRGTRPRQAQPRRLPQIAARPADLRRDDCRARHCGWHWRAIGRPTPWREIELPFIGRDFFADFLQDGRLGGRRHDARRGATPGTGRSPVR